MYCFGVEINKAQIKIGMFKNNQLFYKISLDIKNNDNCLKIAVMEIHNLIKKFAVKESDVIGIGFGLPSQIDEQGFVEEAKNVGWKEKNVYDELKQLTNLPITVCNDATASAIGELWLGNLVNCKNAIVVTLGDCIYASIVCNGQIIFGSNGLSSNLGHMCINLDETELYNDKNAGCLEQYISTSNLVKIAKNEFFKSTLNTMVDPNDISAKKIFDLAAYGDFVADKTIDVACNYLAVGLVNASTMFNPERIIIAGELAKAGNVLLNPLCLAYRKRASSVNKNVKITLAKLGEDACIYGAAKLILDKENFL